MVDPTGITLHGEVTDSGNGPRGPRPRRRFSRRNIFIYGTLIVVSLYYLLPLYVMVVTSLKGMPEIRLGNIFAPPMEITFQPWVKAWAQACTGLNCDGLSRGFMNSVIITVPSVIISIIIASVNGYALANWRFKGADVFFTILIFGAFIPYQVMLYPMVIILREMGIYGTLGGLVLVDPERGVLLQVRPRTVQAAVRPTDARTHRTPSIDQCWCRGRLVRTRSCRRSGA